MTKVHFLHVDHESWEHGGGQSAAWLACHVSDTYDWRYNKRDGSAAKVQTTQTRDRVTCAHCLKQLERRPNG